MGLLTCRFLLRGWLAATVALLAGCALPSPEARSASTTAWAVQQGWQPLLLPGPIFDLQAFVPVGLQRAPRLTVYLEGDGLAWVDRHTPSFAPTPTDPVGLRLAVTDAGARAVYLARPCQYTQGAAFKTCHPQYWGSRRFAPEVIGAMDEAVEQLKRTYRARELVLVGYSGGAAVAALLAARREDVAALVTVAGPLDTELWTQQQRVSPLQGSLNPKDVAPRLRHLPQWHFVGEKDRVVPANGVMSFVQAAAGGDSASAREPVVEQIPDFDHACCWVKAWPQLSLRFASLPPAR